MRNIKNVGSFVVLSTAAILEAKSESKEREITNKVKKKK